MKASLGLRNPFKRILLRVIPGTDVDAKTIRRAYESLRSQDRDCLRPYGGLLR
jgi:hypothetical protein